MQRKKWVGFDDSYDMDKPIRTQTNLTESISPSFILSVFADDSSERCSPSHHPPPDSLPIPPSDLLPPLHALGVHGDPRQDALPDRLWGLFPHRDPRHQLLRGRFQTYCLTLSTPCVGVSFWLTVFGSDWSHHLNASTGSYLTAHKLWFYRGPTSLTCSVLYTYQWEVTKLLLLYVFFFFRFNSIQFNLLWPDSSQYDFSRGQQLEPNLGFWMDLSWLDLKICPTWLDLTGLENISDFNLTWLENISDFNLTWLENISDLIWLDLKICVTWFDLTWKYVWLDLTWL